MTDQPVKSGIPPVAISKAVIALHTSQAFDPAKMSSYFGLVSNLCVALAASGLTLPPEVLAEASKVNAAAAEFIPVAEEAASIASNLPGNIGKGANAAELLLVQMDEMRKQLAALTSSNGGTAPAGGEGA